MQGEFALYRLQPATAETIQTLLAAQAAEHWFDDGLALTKNAARLAMLHIRSVPVCALFLHFWKTGSRSHRLGTGRYR